MMSEVCHSSEPTRKLSPLYIAAAGYTNPLHPIDDNANHKRMSDGVLHWQCTPQVYPFNAKTKANDEKDKKNLSTYTTEYIEKPIVLPKIRPSSIYRRNNPHPNVAFHVKHVLNQGVPVVRTKMTLEEFNRRPIDSPYLSNSHRVYRKYEPKEIIRVKPIQKVAEKAFGIVPELNKTDPMDPVEDTKLFPVIPRNSRLTADRAQGLANAVIKPHRNKYQPHLTGTVSSMSGSYPFRSETINSKPGLKRCKGHPDSLNPSSWDGAPVEGAKTRSLVMGKKKQDQSKIPDAAQAVIPELTPPNSKNLMFKEYSQYPKYAPQMIQEYYGGKGKKNILRPYVY